MKNKLEKLKGFPLSLEQKKRLIELIGDKPEEIIIYYDTDNSIIKVGEFEYETTLNVGEDGKIAGIEIIDYRIDKFLKNAENVTFMWGDHTGYIKIQNVSYQYVKEGFSHKSYYGFLIAAPVTMVISIMVTDYIPN